MAGANRWQVLRHIVLPLITPGILAGSVLTFMAAFGAFSVPLIAGGDYRPLAVEIYKQISIPIPARWSAASAIAMVMGVLQVGFLTLYMRFVRRAGGRRRCPMTLLRAYLPACGRAGSSWAIPCASASPSSSPPRF